MKTRRLAVMALAAGLPVGAAWSGSACDSAATLLPLPDTGADATADTGPELDGAGDGPDVDGPVISDLRVTVAPLNVLAATVTFTTSEPTIDQVVAAYRGDGGAALPAIAAPATPTPTTSHSVNLLGMRASSSFDVIVSVRDAARRTASTTVEYTTGPVPNFVPTISVVKPPADPSDVSGGFTLMTIWEWSGSPALVDGTGSSVVAIDSGGRVVWYYHPLNSWPWDAKKLANGHVLFIDDYSGATEIDMLGNVVQSFTAASLGLRSFEEEILPEDGGAYLSLSAEERSVGGYGPDGGTTLSVVGDRISELVPDGGVVNHWSTLDMLDAGYVVPFGFNSSFYDFLFPAARPTHDWSHGDSLFVDPRDNGIVASLRNLDWIIKFDRSGQVLWRLGPNGDLKLTSIDGGATKNTFQYWQYGANLLPSGNVMCFDTGTDRPPGADGGPIRASRAVEFALDLKDKRAVLAWEFHATPPLFSSFAGSATLLPNGNVLICDGGEVTGAGTDPTIPTLGKSARILEVTHTLPSTVVSEFDIRGPAQPSSLFSGYSVYRAIHIPSLY